MAIILKTGCISYDATAIGKQFGGNDLWDIQDVIAKRNSNVFASYTLVNKKVYVPSFLDTAILIYIEQ